MGVWAIIVNCLFPVPLVALLLLCLPLPGKVASPVRNFVNSVLNKVLFSRILGGFSLYQLSTLLSSILFLEASWATVRSAHKVDQAETHLAEEHLRCNKWRSERNFWIAMFSLVLWLILYRVHQLSKDYEALKCAVKKSVPDHSHTE